MRCPARGRGAHQKGIGPTILSAVQFGGKQSHAELAAGIAFAELIHRRPFGVIGMALWGAQMALNFLWSPIFFTAHWPTVALAVIVMLFVAILGFIARQWSDDTITAALFIPYAIWVGFASILNVAIVRLN